MLEHLHNLLSSLFFDNAFLGTFIASMLPVIEARGAIPLGLSNDLWLSPLNPINTFISSFLGATLMTLILLLVTYPICAYLKRLKFVKSFIEKLENKVNKIKKEKDITNKTEFKKYLFLCLFTALPVPLTGYYTASLIASFCSFNKWKSLIAISLGNLICILAMLAVSVIASEYVTLLFYFFVIAFIVTVLYFVIDSIIKRKRTNATEITQDVNNTKAD